MSVAMHREMPVSGRRTFRPCVSVYVDIQTAWPVKAANNDQEGIDAEELRKTHRLLQ